MGTGARVWVTRTLPGAEATASRLTVMGYHPVVAPLLEVRYHPDAMAKAPAARDIACLALTSPNAISAIAGASEPFLTLPTYAVGDATAKAARDAGFMDVHSASGDIHDLAVLIRAQAPWGTVFTPGAQLPAGDLPALLADRQVIRLPVYSTEETGIAIPDDIAITLIHSPRAGQALAWRLGELHTRMHIIAISDAAARPFIGLPMVSITTADHPDEEAMLRALGNSTSAV